ncbi:hypothetical protein PsorP6_017011 [Peronosclerospora sorghi]|uniref:Uncharacterized protein n=1 Tax=Peronosclerospora sorghi TaxID=230839 RepID=A0ACC0WES2_9STRA|nr:hypothetical protein PsorP6_017011 [Peronosclerospora sorghi]
MVTSRNARAGCRLHHTNHVWYGTLASHAEVSRLRIVQCTHASSCYEKNLVVNIREEDKTTSEGHELVHYRARIPQSEQLAAKDALLDNEN